MPRREEPITALLEEWGAGVPGALEDLMPLVVQELRTLARSHFRHEAQGHTLQPTALVNEVYLRLARQLRIRLENRTQFFAFASRLMRRVLVDHYRSRQTAKRGTGSPKVSLDEAIAVADPKGVDLLALDDALTALKELDPRQSRVVELRYFGGLTIPEVAEVLDLSPATVKREWMTAKAWLQHEIAGGHG